MPQKSSLSLVGNNKANSPTITAGGNDGGGGGNGMENRLVKLESDVDNIKDNVKDIKSGNRWIIGLAITGFVTAIGITSLQFDRVGDKFDRVEDKFDVFDGRLDNLEVSMGKVEVKLDNVEARLEGIEVKLNSVETILIDIRSSLNKEAK